MRGAGTVTYNGKSVQLFLTTSYFDNSNFSAVILAGGDGVRLSSYTREVYGYHLPKQFCPLFEGRRCSNRPCAGSRSWGLPRKR
jgi:hypothetical protein